MIREATFRLDPWKWDVVVLHGEGRPGDLERYVKGLGIPEPNVGVHANGHAWVWYGVVAIMWVKSLKMVPELVHEVVHVVSGILEGRGMKFTRDSEEAYTYAVEHLLRMILAQKKWDRVPSRVKSSIPPITPS